MEVRAEYVARCGGPSGSSSQRRIRDSGLSEDQIRRRRQSEAWRDVVSRVGQRYAHCRLNNFVAASDRQRRVVEAVREYAGSLPDRVRRGEGVVLYGPVGTGKDHLAIGVLAVAVGSDMSVCAVNAQDWYGRLRDRMSAERGESEAELIRELVRPELLLLSDLVPPIGGLSAYQAMLLYRLLDDRYSRRRVTLATLNVETVDEAEEAIGATSWDRLCDGAWLIACQWASKRKPERVV